MNLETFKAALQVAYEQTHKEAFKEGLESIDRLGHFSWHCLVNGLRDMEEVP